MVAAVVTPASGAHSTPSQTTGLPAQDELIRNLVALLKEDPGAGLFTLAMKLEPHHRLGLGSEEVIALLKTVRQLLVERRCEHTTYHLHFREAAVRGLGRYYLPPSKYLYRIDLLQIFGVFKAISSFPCLD